MKKWKIAGVNFDHLHMGDNLRMAFEHPRVDVVGICDEHRERMQTAIETFSIAEDRVFTDFQECLETTRPDIVLLCPATARHGEWTQKIAPFGVHIIMEKPFAASLAEADTMIDVMNTEGKRLAINWPLAWYPPHVTTKRLIDAGVVGDPLEIHYYDGNRGPLWHVADKIETTAEQRQEEKQSSWFYKKAHGGGSLLDYLGYGATLGTWYQGGRAPIEITSISEIPSGLEVDEHSVTVARYAHGLSKFETRWGTFTDPWTHQPQPKCGFVVVGSEGTISSYDFESTIRVQDRANVEGRDIPVDSLQSPFQNPVQYVIDCIENERTIEGPLSPDIARIGQRIVDTAALSAERKQTLKLIGP
ncbi:MAG: Gfo/Idh/MocA family oxidoreductase [Planctomycetes bacterium]|nr:Gfo/Idh/MocA family oxidoreductase [Planctomycetota bacterium]